MQTYYQRNKQRLLKKAKDSYHLNREKKIAYAVAYQRLNKEKKRVWAKRYRDKNRAKRRKWLDENKESILVVARRRARARLSSDPQFKLACALRHRVNMALRGGFKAGSGVRDLGCTIPELRVYIEKQFLEGMTWENWGIRGWHLDHRTPISRFNLTDREEFLKAAHYTNLQPLWAEVNILKSDKYDSLQ